MSKGAVRRERESGADIGMDSGILLPRARLDGILTGLFGAVSICAAAFGVLGHYTRQETVRGEIVARGDYTVVVTEQPGVISKVYVSGGEFVEAGQLLAEIKPPPVNVEGGNTAVLGKQRLTQSRRHVDEQLAETLISIEEVQRNIAAIDTSRRRSRHEADLSLLAIQQQREGAIDQVKAVRTLAARGFASKRTVSEVESVGLQLDQGVAAARLNIAEINRSNDDRLMSAHAELRGLRQTVLQLRSQKLDLDTQIDALQAQDGLRVLAPAAGIVRAVGARTGARVEAGERLFAVSRRDAGLVVALPVPSRAIGFVEPGQRVVLKYDAYPFESFGLQYGQVMSVQQAPLDAGTQSENGGSETEADRHYLVEVVPDDTSIAAYGRERPLRVGMAATAEIAIERRNLASWLVDPLISFGSKLK